MSALAGIKIDLAEFKAARSFGARSEIPSMRHSRRDSGAVVVIDSGSGKSKHLQSLVAGFEYKSLRNDWEDLDPLVGDWRWYELKDRGQLGSGEIISYGSDISLDRVSDISLSDSHVESVFSEHVEKWKSDTMFLSSTEQIILHRSYQRIIGLGPAVLPLIFDDLEKSYSHWFWALEAITGESPVKKSQSGDIVAMADEWLAWAKLNGYR